MPQPDESFSRRAKILTRVLNWINQDRFEDYGSWMLLGNRCADIDGQMEVLYRRDKPEDEPGKELLSEILVDPGKVTDARRTSLERRPPASTLDPDTLPEDWRAKKETSPDDATEFLDIHYSAELVGKLEKVVERAASLEPHEADVGQIHDAGVRAYFNEAHRCYLYEFNAACAVMCRAMLESALKEKYDPRGIIASRLLPGESLMKKLLDESKLEEALKDGAGRIAKKAGDNAVHNYRKFERDFMGAGKIPEVLAVTRKVLVELYPQTPDA